MAQRKPQPFDPEAFDQRIRDWIDTDDAVIVPLEAQRFVDAQPDDELLAWLVYREVQTVGDRMREIIRSDRQRRAHHERNAAVIEFRESVKAGKDARGAHDLMRMRIHVGVEERRLGTLNHEQAGLAAEHYESNARASNMRSAFLRLVQRKLPKDGSRVVSDVFTEEQLRAMWEQAA